MNPTRRQVLALVPGALAAGTRYRPVLAAQLYVWQQEFNRRKKSLAEAMEEAFAETRRAGFTRLEITSQFFTPDVRGQTAALLRKFGLDLPIVYNGGPMHEPAGAGKTIAETVALAEQVKPLGARAINFNPSPKAKRESKTDAELDAQARALDKLAGELHARGMRLFIHQHDPEMRDEAREWRHTLRHTDPRLVLFGVDVDWVKRGGQDPLTILREAGARLASLHLRNASNGIWSQALGEGDDVNYRLVAAYLKESKYDGYLVVELAYEKDTVVTRTLPENLRLSRISAERVFGL